MLWVILSSTLGCSGGHKYAYLFYPHADLHLRRELLDREEAYVFSRIVDGENLVLQYYHHEKPFQFLVQATDQGITERLYICLPSPETGKALPLDERGVRINYEYGGMALSPNAHDEVSGTVTLHRNTGDQVVASLDVVVKLAGGQTRIIEGTYTFVRDDSMQRTGPDK